MAAEAGGLSRVFKPTSLYVGDLDLNVNESQLYEVFNEVGEVISVRVCKDLNTSKSLGYGYVNYCNPQDAARAMEVLNFTPINGKNIKIMSSHRAPHLPKSGTDSIFIKNLAKSIDNKFLLDIFSSYGSILSCKIATYPNGQSKGYGVIQFDCEEAAQSAIEEMDGMLINNKELCIGPFLRKQETNSAGRASDCEG